MYAGECNEDKLLRRNVPWHVAGQLAALVNDETGKVIDGAVEVVDDVTIRFCVVRAWPSLLKIRMRNVAAASEQSQGNQVTK